MDEQDSHTDTTPSDAVGEKRKAHPNSLANLRPAWPPGCSGNPSGLAKDGGGTKDHPIRAQLRAKLAKRREVRRLVETWWEAACNGDSKAREQILDRLDPVEKDTDAGKTILQGLKLEITAGGASLTMGQATLQPTQQQELTAASASESFAQDERPESRRGGPGAGDLPSRNPASPDTPP